MSTQIHKALKQIRLGDEEEMWEAAKQLSAQQDATVAPELLKLLTSSGDVKRRVVAASVLGSLRSLAAAEPLIRILENRQEPARLRDEAAEALGYLGDATARQALVRNLSDNDASVAFSCAFALRTVGELDDIPHLEKLARNLSLTNSYGASVAQEARNAMVQIRNRRSQG